MEEEECVWCERGLALVCLLFAFGIAYMAADTLLGGKLSRSIVGSSRSLASVTDLHPEAPAS
jgi:uncharacterized SAM-binding protein YcdF (DUF218 family)